VTTLPPQLSLTRAVARWMSDAIAVFAAQNTKPCRTGGWPARNSIFDAPTLADMDKLKTAIADATNGPLALKGFPTKGARPIWGDFCWPPSEGSVSAHRRAHEFNKCAARKCLSYAGTAPLGHALSFGRYEAEKQKTRLAGISTI